MQKHLRLKYLKIGPSGLAALGIIGFAVALRLFLTSIYLPTTGTDEGTMGIEAMHIAFRGEHPIFFYGQYYMGTIEAYLGAVFFHLFGVSIFSLRLGMILLYTLFLLSLYALTRLLYTTKLALFSLLLLSLGGLDVLTQELRAVGGAEETLLFGTVILLLASWLALTAGQATMPQQKRWRWAAYSGWGFTVGLALWTHLLVVPFVLTGGMILLVFCQWELLSPATLFLLVSFVIGAFPLISFNLSDPAHNSLSTALGIHGWTGQAHESIWKLLQKDVIGTFLYSLPVATGLNPICSWTDLPTYGSFTSHTVPCIITHGGWSLGYMALMIIAIFLAGIPLLKALHQGTSRAQLWTADERKTAVIHFVRLMLLCSAAMTIALYVSSPLSGLKPWSTRYLVGLLIALPAVLWPLWGWAGIENIKLHSRKPVKFLADFNRVVLLVICAAILGTTVITCSLIPGVQATDQQQEALIQDLLHIGATHIYSDYWTCDRLIFQSQERIICAVLDAGTFDRYAPYRAIVEADPRAAYVYPLYTIFITTAEKKLEASCIHYRQYIFDGYEIIFPQKMSAHICFKVMSHVRIRRGWT